jgi:hypothetical protein
MNHTGGRAPGRAVAARTSSESAADGLDIILNRRTPVRRA